MLIPKQKNEWLRMQHFKFLWDLALIRWDLPPSAMWVNPLTLPLTTNLLNGSPRSATLPSSLLFYLSLSKLSQIFILLNIEAKALLKSNASNFYNNSKHLTCLFSYNLYEIMLSVIYLLLECLIYLFAMISFLPM